MVLPQDVTLLGTSATVTRHLLYNSRSYPGAIWIACLVVLMFALAPAGAQQQRERFDQVPELPRAPMPDVSGPFSLPDGAQLEESIPAGVVISSRAPIRTQDSIGYASGRTRIEYQQFVLEADRMVIDYISGDVEAEGNVVFRGPREFIHAQSARFNLVTSEGLAYGAEGQVRDIYFRVTWDESEKGPAFRQLDENESIFRGMQFTACDFPVPHYYVTSSEVILVRNERVYFRNPVLWVRGWPVLWLPWYSRGLDEGSPWWFEFGYASRIGAFIRLGYRYVHQIETPSWNDPDVYETRSADVLDSYVDMMSNRGLGIGARYRYQFDYRRHTGYMELYGLRDSERDIDADGQTEHERWAYRHLHNSLLTDKLVFQWDANLASDPDIYYDVLDRFAPAAQFEHGRLFEQRVRAALTWREDDFVLRGMADRKDRLGRDRYTDFTDPFDDDLDFDPDPNFTDGINLDDDDEGIPDDRYGRVSENAQARFGTRLLNLGAAPLYYRFEANAFDSLDNGFNTLNSGDDARVHGADAYFGLTNRLRLGRRTTWLNTVGVGAALYDRQNSSLVTNQDFLAATPDTQGVRWIDGVRYTDRETILLGDGTREASMNKVSDGYLFADYRSRLNHRLTDFFDVFAQYEIRQGTNDSLGEFYERIGRREAQGDIYDFYTDRHFIEGGIHYYLRYPNLSTSFIAGHNLQDTEDIYANEMKNYVAWMNNYANQTNEFRTSFGITYQNRQVRDQDDPNEYTQGTLSPYLNLAYFPHHARYWAMLDVSTSIKTKTDPVDRDVRQERRYDEDQTDINIAPTVGRQFGPKYRVQLSAAYTTRYDVWRRAGVTILRDLHDAEIGLFLGIRNNSFKARRDDSDFSKDRTEDYEYEVRGSLRFKIAQDQPGLGARSITTLSDLREEAQYVQ